MSALAQCDAFAFIYDQAGDPAPDVLVVLKRVLDASGNPILLGPKTTLTDSAGSFHFTLPELATAFISARASALWNCPEGRAFTVPPGPSGELVPDFSLPASTLVQPPLVYVGDVLSIPKASETQDGYLSAADYVAFLAAAGADVGITQINTGAGLTGGPITETGTISLATISGVAGTWSNPTSITVNAQGQIISITAGAPDIIPPTITFISAIPGGTSATVTWTTNEPADSQVEYGPTTAYGTLTAIDPSPVTSHSVPLTGLAAMTLYHFRVKSRDTASNLQTSGDNTFTTTSGPDVTAPVISAVASSALTATGATITWTTNEAADSQVEYGLTTSYGNFTTLNPSMVTSHSVPLTGLTGSTLYHYRVKSKDAAANPATSGDNTFTTAAPPDVTPPVISSVSSGSISDVDAFISWTTNEPADSQVEYGTSTSYGTSTTLDTALVTSHTVHLTTLTANTLYHYRVKSKDAAGNPATPVTGTFTTTAPTADLLTGLTSMWKLDETGAANRADSHGANTLTVALGTGTIASVAGKIGNAAHFVGDTTILGVGSNASLQTGGIDYSIALWVKLDSKPTAPDGADAICKAGTGPGDEYIVGYDAAGDAFRFTVQGSSVYRTVLSTPAGSPVVGTWYLIIAWHDQATTEISIQVGDATTLYPVNTFSPVPPLVGAGDPVSIGYYGQAVANPLHGSVDEVAYWKGRKLSNAADRAALWASGAGLPFGSWT